MAKKTAPEKKKKAKIEKREQAMVEGIIEGSPDAIGVVIIRIECGCRKMAAVDKDGEPASKMIIYRDSAESICDKCKNDQGAFIRVTESIIFWVDPEPDTETKKMIEVKVLGTSTTN